MHRGRSRGLDNELPDFFDQILQASVGEDGDAEIDPASPSAAELGPGDDDKQKSKKRCTSLCKKILPPTDFDSRESRCKRRHRTVLAWL